MVYTINEGMFMTLTLAWGQNKYVCVSAWKKLGTVGRIKILFFSNFYMGFMEIVSVLCRLSIFVQFWQ